MELFIMHINWTIIYLAKIKEKKKLLVYERYLLIIYTRAKFLSAPTVNNQFLTPRRVLRG